MSISIQYTITIVLAHRSAKKFKIATSLAENLSQIRILSENKAFEYSINKKPFKSEIKHMLQTNEVQADISISSDPLRKKKLLICDMDSTLIGQECIDELADFAGVKMLVSKITESAMNGEINFEEALIKRVRLLKNLNISVLKKCFQERITINKGAKVLCQTMKANGAKTAIVSGGFTFFTSKVALACGFDMHSANELISVNGILTGEVKKPILGRTAKLNTLNTLTTDLGGSLSALAIGDGANDLSMIKAAGLGIAYKAKQIVASEAQCEIKYTDLTSALYFQGYSEREFISC